MKKKSSSITAPAHLTQIGKNHYRQLVKALSEKDIFESVDRGVVEMLSSLYSEFRDMSLTNAERRQAIKLYAALIKEYGGTPASRQALKLKAEQEEPTDELADFFGD